MSYYVGIDLHSDNDFIGIVDKKDTRILTKKLPNEIGEVLNTLKPFKRKIKGVVVESTYNWYWLVDGLMDNKYKVHLANPSQMQQYSGMKHTDDKWDSFWLALKVCLVMRKSQKRYQGWMVFIHLNVWQMRCMDWAKTIWCYVFHLQIGFAYFCQIFCDEFSTVALCKLTI